MIKVTIWNEFVHERDPKELGEKIRKIYPNGMHALLKEKLASPDLDIRLSSLEQPEQGLPDSLLNDTDVLLWWGHCAHAKVEDALVDRIQKRVLSGMGLIVLHSGHFSKIFKRLMGTSCSLHWRDVGEKERLWCLAPNHPITQGVPETFTLPHSEMYGEHFEIPDDGKLIYVSWYEGGNVFRSGVAFNRDNGKIFYFSPGHETYPIYYDANVLKVIGNAIRWAAPLQFIGPRTTHLPEPDEKVYTPNPMSEVNTDSLHVEQK